MPAAGEPIFIADILKVIRASSERPIVRCVANATQSITDNTVTAIAFAAEDWDTNGFHDPVTNNSRITPNIAGYYRFTGAVFMGGRTDYVSIDCAMRKNGGTAVAPAERKIFSTAATQVSGTVSVQCTVQMLMNGTTDYCELVVLQDNAANAAQVTAQSLRFSSAFECELLRY